MTPRLLSYTEISTALTCWAQWDFAYGGRLAGDTLKKREVATILSEGRAWGAAVASWHQHADQLTAAWDAHRALRESLEADVAQMAASGFSPDPSDVFDTEERLSAILDHYIATTQPLPNLERLEQEIVVRVPSRSGSGRGSTKYRFHCFIDGFTDDAGQRWLVEFKLRGRLTDPLMLERQRQPRWYAWAHTRAGGLEPLGVLVDERLNEAPHPARLVNARRKADGINGKVPSHDKAQITTPEAYSDLCHEYGELPKLEVVEALRARSWQQRFPIVFRDSEMDEAGKELVSGAKLIAMLDSGELTPIRNAKPATCNSCRYRDVCSSPGDVLNVDTLFERTVPKRLREPQEKEVA